MDMICTLLCSGYVEILGFNNTEVNVWLCLGTKTPGYVRNRSCFGLKDPLLVASPRQQFFLLKQPVLF